MSISGLTVTAKFLVSKELPSLKLTRSPLKMMVSNRNLLFQGSIFRGYVSLREGTCFWFHLLSFFLDTKSLARKYPNSLLSFKFKHSQNLDLYAINTKIAKNAVHIFLPLIPQLGHPDMSSTNLRPMVSDTQKTYQFGEVKAEFGDAQIWHGRKMENVKTHRNLTQTDDLPWQKKTHELSKNKPPNPEASQVLTSDYFTIAYKVLFPCPFPYKKLELSIGLKATSSNGCFQK